MNQFVSCGIHPLEFRILHSPYTVTHALWQQLRIFVGGAASTACPARRSASSRSTRHDPKGAEIVPQVVV